jgi:hypothetical protein
VTSPILDWDGVAPLPAGTEWVPSDKPGVFRLRDEAGTPLLAGIRDTRALLDGPLGPRIQLPFRDADGNLAVRVWDQPVYAEVGDVDADTDGLRLRGRLYGALLDHPVIEARCGDTTTELPVTADGLSFHATITALPPGTWSLHLRHAPAAEPVTLGRFRDDIVDKRTAFLLPATGKLHPAYTESNEFTIRVTS